MATGDEQDNDRQLELGCFQHGRVQMTFEVVHPDEGHTPCECECLGGADPDEQGADQPRADCRRHRIDPERPLKVLEATPAAVEARALEGIGHDRQGELDMRAPRELGHDAAVAGVQVHLAGDD